MDLCVGVSFVVNIILETQIYLLYQQTKKLVATNVMQKKININKYEYIVLRNM